MLFLVGNAELPDPDWALIMAEIQHFANNVIYGPGAVRTSLVAYSRVADIRWTFSLLQDLNTLNVAINTPIPSLPTG